MSNQINFSHFPTAIEIHIQNGDHRWLKRSRDISRYFMARVQCRGYSQPLLDFLNNNDVWATLFKQNIHRFNALLFKYADKRFSPKQRLEAICQNFDEMQLQIGQQNCQKLVSSGTIKLVQLTDEFSLNLDIYNIDPFEGFFSLSLVDSENRHLYNASFTFLNENKLLITCIQGPKGADAQNIVKNLTKKLHGMRPMYLLVEAFRLLAQGMNKELVGIPLEYQVKKRWYGAQKVYFDYNAFWKENEATLANGYWHLSSQIERRDLNEVATKKRSMYRKRYAMFDLMEAEIMKKIKV
ncbi:VirK/YbjX family protein [Pasteurella skyensis]|uniref:VirK/YbjX family protein n=1 Tax=Phocoenobacter skyensis TaxID=97481 RepID=A0AAJ6N9X2_9PAST|nr:VirK/YbjX family protein [Pasteurella skyensis]MDP8162921.1 VirK/YbjX family protein [Pasteurella skyensis]MDP8172927.1 VirK/YbjX family protein [Pasteurella skyensis]MDP8176627.1 VirK/YbjX family protein [Pasteurella skyensis]MDP8179427.1 VirK/YbjX family protein [Pasteurella skyensis]MDP8183531.1 VirK/YbjX family protein [Pasteurella skyensis]